MNEVIWQKSSHSGAGDCVEVGWRKSSRSGQGDCVEVGDRLASSVLIRDTKDRTGPVLAFPPRAWRSFAARVKVGA